MTSTDIPTGESAQKKVTLEDHLEAATQSIREAVESITVSTDWAFSDSMNTKSLEEIYRERLQNGVGQCYNKIALSVQEIIRLHAETFAHIENRRQRIELQEKLRAKLQAQKQRIQLNCASIPGSFPLVRKVGECVLNIGPGTSGRYDPDFIDYESHDSNNSCLYRWRRILTECARDMNNAWTCISTTNWSTSFEELKTASRGCAVRVEILLGNFRDELS